MENLQRIEAKLDAMDRKLNEVILELKTKKLRDIHLKILDLAESWVSTSDLSKVLHYRQEYISRAMGDLRGMDLVEERRDKKKIQYKKKS
ncbi:MAG: hypothetical protein HZB68_02340 [Candidatus Aenigmarchaeota archaeon]|nr:hypothetical protein [Candidatus Aenigmarchaeota archaeon]